MLRGVESLLLHFCPYTPCYFVGSLILSLLFPIVKGRLTVWLSVAKGPGLHWCWKNRIWFVLCGLLLTLACQGVPQWRSPAVPGDSCDPSVLSGVDARWNATFGSSGQAYGCLQLVWRKDGVSRTNVLPVIVNKEGQVYAWDHERSSYTEAQPTFSISPDERDWERRFRLYLLSSQVLSITEHTDQCAPIKDSRYDCFSSSSQKDCWLYFAFQPQQEESRGTLAPLPGGKGSWCEMVTGATRPPPIEVPKEPVDAGGTKEQVVDEPPRESGPIDTPPAPPVCSFEARPSCRCVPSVVSMLRTVQDGNNQRSIREVLFHPNGTWLAIRTDAKEILIWDVVQDKLLFKLTSHEHTPDGMVFSGDGTLLASFAKRVVRIWNVQTGLQERLFEAPKSSISGVSFDPKLSSRLVIATAGEEVYLWSFKDGDPKVFFSSDPALRHIAFTPDGRRLVAASERSLAVWSADALQVTPKSFQVVPSTSPSIQGMALHPDGRRVALVFGNKVAQVWDIDASKQVNAVTLGSEGRCLSYASNGKWLAVGQRNDIISVWDTSMTPPVQRSSLTGHTRDIESVHWHPSGYELVSAAQDRSVRHWQCKMCEPAHHLRLRVPGAHASQVNGILASRLLGRWFSISAQGKVKSWSLGFKSELWQHDLSTASPGGVSALGLALSGDDKVLLVGNSAGYLTTLTSAGGKKAHEKRVRGVPMSFVSRLTPSGGGFGEWSWLSLDGNGGIRRWNLDLSRDLQLPSGDVLSRSSQAVVSGGRYLLIGTTGGEVSFMDLALGRRVRLSRLSAGVRVSHMAATTLPEGGEVVALVLSQNKLVIRLFSGDNFASRPRLEKPLNGQVTAMTWDALGRFLWLGWKDGRVTAWKITKKDDNFLVEERIVVKAHDSSVSMISFLGNGLRFATGSHQGQLAFWGCP